MADTARQNILSRLRQGLGRHPFTPAPAPTPEHVLQPCAAPENAWENIGKELSPIGGALHLAQTPEAARAILVDLLREYGKGGAMRWSHSLLDTLELDACIKEAGIELHEATGDRICPALAELGVGITAIDAAFALAGTLVVMAGEGRPRSASLVPPVHIACLPQSALYEDLSSLPALLRQRLAEKGRLPSALHMITGSSSTADIEQTLVRPAHGPAKVIVLGLCWL